MKILTEHIDVQGIDTIDVFLLNLLNDVSHRIQIIVSIKF